MNNTTKYILAGIALSIGLSAAQAADLGYDNDPYFSDITLINCGNNVKRARWTEADWEPYLTHKYADGHEDWFFDAFLLVDTNRGFKKFGNDISGYPGSQVDWSWMMDQFFDPELKLHALDNLIDKKKQTLGEPPLPHRIVLSLCVPTKASDGLWARTAWGRIDCLNVNHRTLADRLRTMKWYVDELITRFAAEKYRNLTLAGIYWIEEGIWTNQDLVAKVNDYVHERGLRSYWIPYYKDNKTSWSKAHNYNFDLTYLQPNYAFGEGSNALPKSILKDCCDAAKLYGLGLEFEFETIEASSALHEVNPALHQRIHDYMDAFEEYGVVDGGAIAYYTGSQGLIDMDKSEDPVNHATMDRLAQIVAKRQASIAHSAADNFDDHVQIAYPGQGCIYVNYSVPEAQCYDMTGRLIHSGAGYFNCPAGIYIVSAPGHQPLKLQVK